MILAATHLLMVSALTPHLHMFFLQSKISNQSIIFSRYMLYHGLRYVSLQLLKLILTNIKTKPGWMKSSGSMNGGSLSSTYVSICEFIYLIAVLLRIAYILIFSSKDANYLLKCVQGFANKNATPYALSIQVRLIPISLSSQTG